MLPPTARLPEVRRLIDEKMYFVLHAPRQVGKTTALLSLGAELTREGRYTAVLVSMEVGSAFPNDPAAAELAILSAWQGALMTRLPPDKQPPPWPDAPAGGRIGAALRAWAQACHAAGRPLVVFLDEVDSLQDEPLISVLRQLRDGYADRPQGFPQSLCLIGMRDVRDYKVKSPGYRREAASSESSGGSDHLHTASPFNVKVESLTLRNFTAEETTQLLLQHTRETGQTFETAALTRIFGLTQGQPWLVNALARQLVRVLVPDPKEPITAPHVDRAKEILIQRQDTHLDSLAERLKEDRVRRIVEPILAGTTLDETVSDEDKRFIIDLGLCRRDPRLGLMIANPIYQEVIPRILAQNPADSIRLSSPVWLDANGCLVPEKLLAAFLDFWRENGEALMKSAPYHEVAPHLVLMAFLHRVVNGGGTIQREYAIGTRRMDLCMRYGEMMLGIELKVWRPKQPDPLAEGLHQLDEYLEGIGQNSGWLVIFDRRDDSRGDRRPRRPPLVKRTTAAEVTSPGGRRVTVIRA